MSTLDTPLALKSLSHSRLDLTFWLSCLVVALIFLPSPGTSDILIWLVWGQNTWVHGLVNGYALNAHEHPPGLSMMLWVGYFIAKLLSVHPMFGIKITFLPFLFYSTAILYRWSNKNSRMTFFFHVMLCYSCMALSYIDIYFAPFFLLAFKYLNENNLASGLLFFSIACFFKYPPLIVLPYFLFFILFSITKKPTLKSKSQALFVFIPSILVALFSLIAFGLEPLHALKRAFEHNTFSAQALNINWIISRNLIAGGISPSIIPADIISKGDFSASLLAAQQIPALIVNASRILFASLYGLSFILFILRDKTIETLVSFSLLGHLTYFMFAIGAHENHMFVSCLLASILYCINKNNAGIAVGVFLASSINMFLFYGLDGFPLDLFFGPLADYDQYTHIYPPYPFDIRLTAALINAIAYYYLYSKFLKGTT